MEPVEGGSSDLQSFLWTGPLASMGQTQPIWFSAAAAGLCSSTSMTLEPRQLTLLLLVPHPRLPTTGFEGFSHCLQISSKKEVEQVAFLVLEVC